MLGSVYVGGSCVGKWSYRKEDMKRVRSMVVVVLGVEGGRGEGLEGVLGEWWGGMWGRWVGVRIGWRGRVLRMGGMG